MRSVVLSVAVVVALPLVSVAYDKICSWAGQRSGVSEIAENVDRSEAPDPIVEAFESRRAELDRRLGGLKKSVSLRKREVTGLAVEIEQSVAEQEIQRTRLDELRKHLEAAKEAPPGEEPAEADSRTARLAHLSTSLHRARMKSEVLDKIVDALRTRYEREQSELEVARARLAKAEEKIRAMDEKLVEIVSPRERRENGVTDSAREEIEALFAEIEGFDAGD